MTMTTSPVPVGQEAPTRVSPAPRKPGPLVKTAAWACRQVSLQRWHVAPAAGGGLVFWAGHGGDPLPTAVALLAGAAVSAAAAWKLPEVKGRKWLSARERWMATGWLAAASGWAAVYPVLSGLPWWGELLTLSAAVGYPTWLWWANRPLKRTPKVSKDAKAAAGRWNTTFHADPSPLLRGSTVESGSITAPADGVTSFLVLLPDGVSAEAFTTTHRQYVESRLDLGADTVAFAVVPERARLLRVTITTVRRLEGADGNPYLGPILEPSGFIPLADTKDGQVAGIDLHDQSGVAHVWINGRTNGGKSTSLTAVLLPGLLAGYELVLYADGKRGQSLPAHLAPFVTKVARTPEQWEAAIETAYLILLSRQERYADQLKSTWHAPTETDPIVTLVLEECAEMGRRISKAHKDMVTFIGEAGRAAGVRLIETTQGPQVWHLVGDVRRNLTQVIAHRAGDANDAKLAITSGNTEQTVDLMSLPGEPGWAVIVRWGHMLKARVRYCSPEVVAPLGVGFVPRQVEGPNIEACRDVYERWGAPAPRQAPEAPADDEPAETVAEARDSRAMLLAILLRHGPLHLREIENHPEWSRSRKTASNHLAALLTERAATQTDKGWQLTDKGRDLAEGAR